MTDLTTPLSFDVVANMLDGPFAALKLPKYSPGDAADPFNQLVQAVSDSPQLSDQLQAFLKNGTLNYRNVTSTGGLFDADKNTIDINVPLNYYGQLADFYSKFDGNSSIVQHDNLTISEIVGILAHELGHWQDFKNGNPAFTLALNPVNQAYIAENDLLSEGRAILNNAQVADQVSTKSYKLTGKGVAVQILPTVSATYTTVNEISAGGTGSDTVLNLAEQNATATPSAETGSTTFATYAAYYLDGTDVASAFNGVSLSPNTSDIKTVLINLSTPAGLPTGMTITHEDGSTDTIDSSHSLYTAVPRHCRRCPPGSGSASAGVRPCPPQCAACVR